MPLAAASSARLAPALAAIAESVSPGCTTHEPGLGVVELAGPAPLPSPAPTSSLSASPSPVAAPGVEPAGASVLDAVSLTPASGPAVPVCCGGIISVLPAGSEASVGNPLAAAS